MKQGHIAIHTSYHVLKLKGIYIEDDSLFLIKPILETRASISLLKTSGTLYLLCQSNSR